MAAAQHLHPFPGGSLRLQCLLRDRGDDGDGRRRCGWGAILDWPAKDDLRPFPSTSSHVARFAINSDDGPIVHAHSLPANLRGNPLAVTLLCRGPSGVVCVVITEHAVDLRGSQSW